MNCPPDIAQVLLRILNRGVLRIRAFACAKEPKKCFIEADHLHNIPSMLADYRPEKLRYYWESERPAFVQQIAESETTDLVPLWDQLANLMESHGVLSHRLTHVAAR